MSMFAAGPPRARRPQVELRQLTAKGLRVSLARRFSRQLFCRLEYFPSTDQLPPP
jgi:hypothetical protein